MYVGMLSAMSLALGDFRQRKRPLIYAFVHDDLGWKNRTTLGFGELAEVD